MANILIVDDEPSMLEFLEIMLKKEGYHVTCSTGGEEAIELCKENPYDMVITDIKMPKVSGLDVLHRVKEISPETIIILITAYATMETAVQAMKEGAYDYISKPFKVAEIKMIIKNALEKREQNKEGNSLQDKAREGYQFGDIHLIGKSKEMMKVYELIQKVAQTKSTVLIYGESGTGKELVARSIHNYSPRKDCPLVTINCGGIPETLLESELFGHKKGSFTGASHEKAGLFDVANTGTIFLDEVGDLPMPIQVKLLRVIQEKTFKLVGGTEEKVVDVRIISATNKDLEEMVIEGEFREDLYYRLNVIQVRIPPLRERRDDIEILANYFLEKYSRELEREIKEISSYAMEALLRYNFPGNVRELETIIERSVALETSNIVLPESLTLASFKEGRKQSQKKVHIEIPPEGFDLEGVIGDMEKNILVNALKRTHGSKKKAAELLQISFRSMRYKLEKYGIKDVEDHF